MSTTRFSITKLVPEILIRQPERRMTAREVASLLMEEHPLAIEDKRNRSTASIKPLDTDDAMLQQIVAEIGAQRRAIQKKEPRIKTTEGRPRKFYFTIKEDSEEILSDAEIPVDPRGVPNISTEPRNQITEHDLYPLLSKYLDEEQGVYAKRVDEKRSKNARGRNGNQWLYPDLVGMEDLSKDWDREVIDCAKEYSDKKTKLWSFEVKLRLNGSNVREAYFQSVSNSSWSNIGYLVSAEIEGQNTLNELGMLAGIHGIGVLRLDVENLSESQILIPARERPNVDWSSINRLVVENSDFTDYIRLVRQFYQTGDLRMSDWRANN